MNYKKMARRADVLFGYTRWKWGMGEHHKRPSRPRLEKTIRQLVATLENEGAERAETGRLLAIKEQEEGGGEEIKVCIIIGSERRP